MPRTSLPAAREGRDSAPPPVAPEGGTIARPGALRLTGTLARRAALCVGAALVALPFLDSRLWPLAWLGLTPLFALAPEARSVRSAAVDGLVMGVVVNVLGFHWLVYTINRFGGFPLPLALAFFAVLAVYGAAQFALVAAVLRWAGRGAPLLLAPAIWTAIEFLYPNLFPWRLGHSQRDLVVLLQSGDLAGPYLLSFVMAWLAAALARVRERPRALVAPAVAVVLLVAYGAWRVERIEALLARAPVLDVGVVQGNLSLDEKRVDRLFDSNVARYRRLSESLAPPPDLLVWPETVVEWGIPADATDLGRADPYPRAPAALLFGAVAYRRSPGGVEWLNSAFLRRRDGALGGRYDKIVLMPFGEFIPLASHFPWLKTLSPNTGDFQAGTGPGVLPLDERARIGTLICYEDLLAGHVRSTVRAGATLLVTIANDAWFGDSAALRQHETLALWRAIENRRSFVRATNTGLSSVIDPLGRTVAELPTWTATARTVPVRLLSVTTPYQQFGDVFGLTVLALAISLLIYRRTR